MARQSDLNPEHQERRGEEAQEELLVGYADIHCNRLSHRGQKEARVEVKRGEVRRSAFGDEENGTWPSDGRKWPVLEQGSENYNNA